MSRLPNSRILTIRVPELLINALNERAQNLNLTAGSIARQAIISTLDLGVEAIPVKRYRATNPPPSIDLIAIAGLREVVGEAVGTLRQVAGIDRARAGARLDELDGAISELIAVAKSLDVLKLAYQAVRD